MQRSGFKGEKGYCETDKKISRSIAGAYAGGWAVGGDSVGDQQLLLSV